ncbi:hypothetical protein GCM10009066_05470 [Halarchaeum salinum]|uniref:Anion transporter n=1 Tax=Halarchaeum salinum TaxID=489912 RepID=A0AAV3S5N9_9EURY
MIQERLYGLRHDLAKFVIASLGAILISLAPTPAGLSLAGQYTLATMFFAGFLWITGGLPLAVTALTIPVLLTGTGIYEDLDTALAPFADHLIFLFMAGFMLANAIQKYEIDRRIALYGCVESPYGGGIHCFTARLML